MAARYLILTGTVNAEEGNAPIPEAVVIASKNQAVRAQSACRQPECTFDNTYSNGEFSIDLTRIKAAKAASSSTSAGSAIPVEDLHGAHV